MQYVNVFDNDYQKLIWLENEIREFIDNGDVLVFVNQKSRTEEVVERLKTISNYF